MYRLYFDENRDPAGVFDTKSSAMAIAAALSRNGGGTVIGIYSRSGSDTLCFKYAAGVQTYDGGCCPTPSQIPFVG